MSIIRVTMWASFSLTRLARRLRPWDTPVSESINIRVLLREVFNVEAGVESLSRRHLQQLIS